ncbi:hypothetical protein PIB30_006681 [Stylosanthes scabra]|uniref:SAWADEE domain-containing protein n=1 Tax=Stylosanthes scabra TaxID=79078 RepID=A0ABU6R5M4_9FABA|nr:hypothetical protein [Stylosanthes scabra]
MDKFSKDEVKELERIHKEMGEKSVDQNFCKSVAISFSSSSRRAGKASLTWEQVRHWFQNKLKESETNVASSTSSMDLYVDLSEASILRNGQKSSSNAKGKQAEDISELTFEARSSKDVAWHDVASFLNYRVVSTGELEVRIRYAGFGKEQDEWMNVKEGVRERSIPLEPSECHKVNDGDLVLCFLEKDDYALYVDAHIVQVLRRLHGPTECRCIFVVRYLHDKTEEGVPWNRLCCRPTQEENVPEEIPLNPLEDLWG